MTARGPADHCYDPASYNQGAVVVVCKHCNMSYPIHTLHNCLLPETKPLRPIDSLERQVGGDHYKALGRYQPWQIIEALHLDFFEGSVLKYLLRWRRKNGVEDLRKAIHVLERMIEQQTEVKDGAQ